MFVSLTHFVKNHSAKFLRKPKLTYLVEDRMVIVQWPSRIHEAPVAELAVLFRQHESTSHSQRLRVSTSTNSKIITKTINAVPYLLVSVSSMKAKLLKHLLIFECAFSQSPDKLFAKVKSLATALPDICMVFLFQIHKQSGFHSPILTSNAWERFERDLFPLDLPQFLQLCEEEGVDRAPESLPEEFMGPVTAGGHIWCSISHIQYYVWLRQDNGKLEINPESIKQTQWSAYGEELPALEDGSNMNHITEVVNRGLAAIRVAIMETHQSVYDQIQIPVDAGLFSMPIILPETWNYFCPSLTEAKSHCAFECYQTWYLDSFRGRKRTLSNSDYIPSSQESKLEPEPGPEGSSQQQSHRSLGKRLAHDESAVGVSSDM
ncbi:hypothetical protein OG21DRAFT_1486402, partial [Imleria badia]